MLGWGTATGIQNVDTSEPQMPPSRLSLGSDGQEVTRPAPRFLQDMQLLPCLILRRRHLLSLLIAACLRRRRVSATTETCNRSATVPRLWLEVAYCGWHDRVIETTGLR